MHLKKKKKKIGRLLVEWLQTAAHGHTVGSFSCFFVPIFAEKKTNLRKLLNEALVSAHQLKFGENVKQVLIGEGMRSAARPTAVYNVHTK